MKTKRTPVAALMLTTALLFSTFVLVPANANETARLDRMAEYLSLDDEQTAALAGLFEAHRARLDVLRETHGADDRRSYREEARAERLALSQEIEAVLNDEQRLRFQQFQERQRERRQSREAQMIRALQNLDLSAEQRDAIEILIATHRAERHAQRGAFQSELQQLLTEEQWGQLRETRAGRRDRRGQ